MYLYIHQFNYARFVLNSHLKNTLCTVPLPKTGTRKRGLKSKITLQTDIVILELICQIYIFFFSKKKHKKQKQTKKTHVERAWSCVRIKCLQWEIWEYKLKLNWKMRKLNVGFYTSEGFSRHWTQEMEQEDVSVSMCVHTHMEGRRGKKRRTVA